MQSAQPPSCPGCMIQILELTPVGEPVSHRTLAGSSLQHQFLYFSSFEGNKDTTLAIICVETAKSLHGISATCFYLLKY